MSLFAKLTAFTAALNAGGYDYQFWHCEAEELNRREAEVKDQFVHLDFPLNGEDEIINATNGRIKSTYAVRMFFGILSKLANNQEQRAEGIEFMRQAKCQMETFIFNDNDLEIVGRPTHSEVIEAIDFDFSVDGIYLNLKIAIDETPAC